MMKVLAQCLVAYAIVSVLVVGWMYYVVIDAVVLHDQGLLSGPDISPTQPAHHHDGRSIQPNKTIVEDVTTQYQELSQGHMFIYSSFEEQTNGARNLWQLEMWAKLLDMKVAEPFAVDSMFGVMGAVPHFNQTLRFSNYYDVEKWNQKVTKYGGSPLVKWEEFLSKAPRQAIILYALLRPLKKPLTVTYGVDDIKKYHVSPRVQISDDSMLWIKNNFNISRVVNFVYSSIYQHILTLKEFNSYVFGDLKPNEVTLIWVHWIGIGAEMSLRIAIKSAPSSFRDLTNIEFTYPLKPHSVKPDISPSQQVLKAYKAYVSKYFGNRKYVGIVFRTHNVMYLSPEGGDFAKRSKYLLECSTSLRSKLDKIRNKLGIFLAYDLGAQGDKHGYYDPNDKGLIPLRDQILLDVFNGSVTMEQREEMLLKAAGGITDRGFIAALEKTIAIHADCIILLGRGSSFVRSAASDYISLHDNNRCVVSICSEDFRDQNGTVVSSHTIPDVLLHS
ncbi:uncharacterized protein [Dysidea avara]|uniref:uncharacterized protein n=1 Tax=Dysidea avara TaxID=196820 RepID=UPI00332F8E17